MNSGGGGGVIHSHYHWREWSSAVVLFAVLSACGAPDRIASPVIEVAAPAHSLSSAPPPVRTIARGLALALVHARIRQTVFQDLRDSPFARHRVHVNS